MGDEKPRVQIFDPQSIAVATFLGSPAAGAVLWAINESRVGRAGRGVVALVVGVASTALMMGVGALDLPQSLSLGLSIGATFGARAAAQSWEAQLRAEGRFSEITYASRWLAAGAGMLGCVGVLAIVFGGLAATGGLDAHEGDECTGVVASCTGEHAALWCSDGTLRPIDCTRGCHDDDGRITCEQDLNDRCIGEGGACGTDGSFLTCRAGVLVRASTCRGPNHCTTEGGRIFCDQSVGLVGDACDDEGGHVCSVDGASDLVCHAGALVQVAACPGPGHCHVEGTSVICDPGAP